MFISALVATAAVTTAKWLTAAKIIGATGVFLSVAGPIIDSKIEKSKEE